MLDSLDKTIENLLSSNLSTSLQEIYSSFLEDALDSEVDDEPEISISFEAPDNSAARGSISLNLFLYDIQENLELRSNHWSLGRSIPDNSASGEIPTSFRQKSPARVDCSYLITASTIPANAETEHKLLGEVLKILLRYPQIPSEYLVGDLIGLEPPIRAVTMRPSRLQSLGEFWQATGGRPKAIINYMLTVPVPMEAEESVPLVTQSQTNFYIKPS
jgi:hypothetical protein